MTEARQAPASTIAAAVRQIFVASAAMTVISLLLIILILLFSMVVFAPHHTRLNGHQAALWVRRVQPLGTLEIGLAAGVTTERLAAAHETRAAECDTRTGRGGGGADASILVCAEGKQLEQAAVLAAHLRQTLACRLPIEIWHATSQALTPTTPGQAAALRVLRQLPRVTFHDAYPPMSPQAQERSSRRRAKSAAISAFALQLTRARFAILMDAAVIPLVDPETMLRSAAFLDTGAVFFNDFGNLNRGYVQRAEHWLQLPIERCGRDWACDGGIILFDRLAHWEAMHVAAYMSLNHPVTSKYVVHAQDTFWLALETVGDTRYTAQTSYAGVLKSCVCGNSGWRMRLQRLGKAWVYLTDADVLQQVQHDSARPLISAAFCGAATSAEVPLPTTVADKLMAYLHPRTWPGQWLGGHARLLERECALRARPGAQHVHSSELPLHLLDAYMQTRAAMLRALP